MGRPAALAASTSKLYCSLSTIIPNRYSFSFVTPLTSATVLVCRPDTTSPFGNKTEQTVSPIDTTRPKPNCVKTGQPYSIKSSREKSEYSDSILLNTSNSKPNFSAIRDTSPETGGVNKAGCVPCNGSERSSGINRFGRVASVFHTIEPSG